jgi:2,3-bisphosphoglycerate-independent phosphoglycerate mutase
MQELLDKIKEIGIGEIATVVGRYYAMDRDKRWERIEVGLNAMCVGDGEQSSDPIETIKERYEKGENDEFLKPIIVGGKEARVKGGSQIPPGFIKTNYFRWRSSILLQLPIRSCPRDYSITWRR